MIYMRGRYFSPAWHRFLNSDRGVDPNQFNQYAYVGGRPFTGRDPSGFTDTGGKTGSLDWWTEFWEKILDSLFGSDGSDDSEDSEESEESMPQTTKKKGDCPPHVRAFMTNKNIQATLQTVANALNTRVEFVAAQASMESGWLNPHNAGLNNLFGLTRGGGKNLSFSSLAASGQTYINAPAVNGINKKKVYGATTMQQFIDQLQSPDPYRYNTTRMASYPGELMSQYNYYMRKLDDCDIPH